MLTGYRTRIACGFAMTQITANFDTDELKLSLVRLLTVEKDLHAIKFLCDGNTHIFVIYSPVQQNKCDCTDNIR